jgi:hypothetical protein
MGLSYVVFDLNGAGAVLIDKSVWLVGWSLRNKSNSNPANIDLYDGPSAAGIPTFPITLAANESVRDLFPGDGVAMLNAVYANVTLGEVSGSVIYQMPAITPVLRYARR